LELKLKMDAVVDGGGGGSEPNDKLAQYVKKKL
jgi:hypothetical protein